MSIDDILEPIAVNGVGIPLVLSMAKWSAYFSEPSNIVAFAVGISLIWYNVARALHFHSIHKKK